jgi:hypothetical protein
MLYTITMRATETSTGEKNMLRLHQNIYGTDHELTTTAKRWTLVLDESAHEAALDLAKGSYQWDLLQGYENLSGSTLKGKARKYSARYHESRRSLFERMDAAGIPHCEAKGPRGRRVLVIGTPEQLEAYEAERSA